MIRLGKQGILVFDISAQPILRFCESKAEIELAALLWNDIGIPCEEWNVWDRRPSDTPILRSSSANNLNCCKTNNTCAK